MSNSGWSQKIAARDLTDWELPCDFWWACGEAALEQNWSTGDFSTWVGTTSFVENDIVAFAREHSHNDIYVRAFGVAFLTADIAKVNPDVTEPEDASSSKPDLPQAALEKAHTALCDLSKQLSEENERAILDLLFSGHHTSRDRLRAVRGPQAIGRPKVAKK